MIKVCCVWPGPLGNIGQFIHIPIRDAHTWLCVVDKYQSQFGAGNQFSYYHEEDESSFQLVDTSRPQKPAYQRNRNRFQVTINALYCTLQQMVHFNPLYRTLQQMVHFNPFTPESDQCQSSPAASQEILHHTVWRTWLFIAYSDEKWLYYKFSLHHSYNRFSKGWENILFELRSERVNPLYRTLQQMVHFYRRLLVQ